jgi:hypothetical protein
MKNPVAAKAEILETDFCQDLIQFASDPVFMLLLLMLLLLLLLRFIHGVRLTFYNELVEV